jgi:hypothetical protein
MAEKTFGQPNVIASGARGPLRNRLPPRDPWSMRDLRMSSRVARASIALISGLIALALAASLGRAAEEQQPLDLRYGLYWAGIQIATLKLKHELEPAGYNAKLIIETVGLVDKLANYSARTQVAGELGPGRRLLPVNFSTQYRSRKKERRALVTFEPASGDVVEVQMTKRGRPDSSKVPEALRKGVVDPLTAFLRIRDHVAEHPQDPPTAQVFDGRRRYDLAARVTGRERAMVAGRDQPVVRLALTLTFGAGSNPDDLGDVAVDDDRMELELLLSDDERLLPLEMRMLNGVMSASIELLQDCSGTAGCQLAAR